MTDVNDWHGPCRDDREPDESAWLDAEAAHDYDESTEFQLSEARDVLARWDAGQDGCPECSREKVLANHVRALLAIVDREAASTAGEDR